MKKINCLLFFFMLVNSSFLCAQYGHLEYLKKNTGKIFLAKIKNSIEQPADNSKGFGSYCEYDTLGNLSYSKNWYNGVTQYERKYYYDGTNNLIKITHFNDKNSGNYNLVYEYDDFGRPISEKSISNKSTLVTNFLYDDNSNLIAEIFEAGSSKYHIYEDGKRIRTEDRTSDKIYSVVNYFYTDNSVLEERSENMSPPYYEEKFDNYGNTIELIFYDKNKNVLSKDIYENDEYGNPLRVKDKNMNIISIYHYAYYNK